MPVPAVRSPLLRGRVFRGTWAAQAAVLTKGRLRSGAWRRPRQDVYADAAVPVDRRLITRGVSLLAPRCSIGSQLPTGGSSS